MLGLCRPPCVTPASDCHIKVVHIGRACSIKGQYMEATAGSAQGSHSRVVIPVSTWHAVAGLVVDLAGGT